MSDAYDNEFIELLSALSEEEKQFIVDKIRAILANRALP